MRSSIAPLMLAIALAGCTFGRTAGDLPANLNLAGFTFDVPRGPGWRVAPEHTATMEAVRFRNEITPADDRSVQLSVIAVRTEKPVRTEDDVVAWARGASAVRSAEPARGHGALCARYHHRWTQNMSFDPGAAARPTHEIDDFGLYCVHPSNDGRVVHFRAAERAALGRGVGGFAAQARELLDSVRYRGGPSTVPR